MKTLLTSLMLVSLALLAFVSASEPTKDAGLEEKHRLQKTSKELKQCPDGHTQLKDIPIKYGLYGVHIHPEAQWTSEDKELMKGVARKDYVLGGDVIHDVSPRFRTTCLTCGYYYEVDYVPDDGGAWVKTGQRMSDFTTELSITARSLPFAKNDKLFISVSVVGDKVVREYIAVTIPIDERVLMLQRLKVWIAEHGYNESLLHLEGHAPLTASDQVIESSKARFHISAGSYPTDKTATFAFYLTRNAID